MVVRQIFCSKNISLLGTLMDFFLKLSDSQRPISTYTCSSYDRYLW